MVHPTPNRLVRHRDSAFRQQILDVTQAEGEPQVEPNCLLNDLGRETIPPVADFLHAPDYRANSGTASPTRRDNAMTSAKMSSADWIVAQPFPPWPANTTRAVRPSYGCATPQRREFHEGDAMRVKILLQITADDGAPGKVEEVVSLDKSVERAEDIGLSLAEGKALLAAAQQR